jgi:hypothetical protein
MQYVCHYRTYGILAIVCLVASVSLGAGPHKHHKRQKHEDGSQNWESLPDSTLQVDESAADWMARNKSLLAGKAINQVTLLGSHDAGSYAVVPGAPPAKGYLTHKNEHIKRHAGDKDLLHARCQSADIFDQLLYGVRYLDLRICHQDGKYWIEHMWLSAPCFGEEGAFTQIKDFLKEHPDEIILLSLWQLWSEKGVMTSAEAQPLYREIEREFSSLLIKKSSVAKLTYGEIWKEHGRIIVFGAEFPDGDRPPSGNGYFWEQQEDSKWFDIGDPEKLIAGQDEIINGWREGKSADKLRLLSSMIDAGNKLPDAARTNRLTKAKLQGDWKNAPVSVVQVDDSVKSGLMPAILSMLTPER